MPLAPGNKKAEVILQSLPLFKASNRIELFNHGFADRSLSHLGKTPYLFSI